MNNDSTLIILEDISTWPQEILDYVSPNLARISQERELELAKNLQGKSWLSNIPDSIYVRAQKQLAIMLRSYAIKAYHCTRLISPEKALQKGLLPLSLKTLAKGLKNMSTLLASPEDSVEAELELIHFVKGEDFKNQQGLVWLYLTEAQTQQYDCQDLQEFYGGRSLRAALANKRYKYYPLLKRLGAPAVIACRVQIADATDSQVEALAKLMLDHMLDDANGYPARPLMGELSVNTAVPAAHIIEIQEQLQYT
ncbi:hypothetical protein [Pontibacter amylolyticus]|uniref:Uncharacterized protein n=1 Tax=Pontibacter amylolyticus TaxID=1424080 RepID=A0ABQ1W9A1_9BACT|nr:hypothetical protein [Pontibacter amylolyticus]GGG17669.1 hypothetical protein GCM10011323_22410 [Pontibacter amylolyticus]